MIEKVAGVLKALGEPTRLKIVKFLSLQELCVCELEAILDISQPRVSQHLKVLKHAGIVKERRIKRKAYFSLVPSVLNEAEVESLRAFMHSSLESIPELAQEKARFCELDFNENVLACKEGDNNRHTASKTG